MEYLTSRVAALCVPIALLSALVAPVAEAQTTAAPAVKRTILLQQDMGIPGREVLMVLVELPPGSAEGRHTHNAEVYVFVREGSISLENEGQQTRTVKAGEVFHIAPGKIHQAINASSAPATLSVVFAAEKGKPLTTPAN